MLGLRERMEENGTAPGSGEAKRSAAAPADPEVVDKPLRRRFDPSYKLRIVEGADRCTEPGEVGRLLRREGLYSSHLTTWRNDRPPIVVPPTVLVQPPPEAWGEGRRVSGVSGRPDRAGSLPEPGAGSPESYEDGWCCTRAATVR